MKITWVTRSFLDYRIPIFKELNRLSGNNLTVIYNSGSVPTRCQDKLSAILEERAIGLDNEFIIGKKKRTSSFANTSITIPIQKSLISVSKKNKTRYFIN